MVSLHQQLYPKPTAACHDFSLLLQAPPHGRLKIHPTVGGWVVGLVGFLKPSRSVGQVKSLEFYIRRKLLNFFCSFRRWKIRKGFRPKNTADTLSLQHKCPRHSGEFAQLAVEPIWRHRMSKRFGTRWIGIRIGAPLSNNPFYKGIPKSIKLQSYLQKTNKSQRES